MASNPHVNHVELADGTMLMDIRDTTADAESVENGRVFYSASGARTIGAMPVKLDQVAAYVEYSDSGTYSVGDIRTHGGRIYRCNTAIAEAEEWDVTHWTEVTIGELLFGKADKVGGATQGDVAILDASGNLVDSGKTLGVSVPANAVFTDTTYTFTDNNPTLAWGTQSKIATVGGVDIHVTMPANPNTDHYDWSDITNKPASYPGGCTGTAGGVAWGNVTGKPSEFAPSDNSAYYTLWDGDLRSLGNDTPAATKTYWENSIPGGRVVAAYNSAGNEYTILFGKGSASWGNVIKWGYTNNYVYLLRRQNNSWQSTDWEKIYAGYADSAGAVAWDNVSSKPANFPGGCTGNAATATTASSCSGNAETATKATKDGDGNTITSKYVTLDTSNTISGSKIFTQTIQCYRYSTANNLPAITLDKPGSNYVGIGSDGTANRIKFGPCSTLAGAAWVAKSSFNSNQWYFQGSIYSTSSITAEENITAPNILKVWEGSVKFSSGSVSLSSTLGSSAQIYSCTFNNLGNMGPIIFGCAGANLLAIILEINNGNLVYHNFSGTVTVRVIYA